MLNIDEGNNIIHEDIYGSCPITHTPMGLLIAYGGKNEIPAEKRLGE